MTPATPPRRARSPLGAFRVVQGPSETRLDPVRLARRRVVGPYVPWTRIQTLDEVLFALESAEVAATGPATGVYYDLPRSARAEALWEADLGYPVAPDARLPDGLEPLDLPATPGVALRYEGDLASFPQALAFLLAWAEERGTPARGHLVERFHVSDPVTLAETRDVFVGFAR
ncbi:MAG TPA: GyrI-like domain-containing protein [Candidatus Thermoplasmatota archaeon]|nr:GyrI-like domain-containing protein [Candidatus Thermoplasmatota archaeon]